MATNAEQAYELYQQKLGQPEGSGEWFEVTQELINQFADVTFDHQFIHVDPDKAAELSPWKVTIAHGFLTLSLLTHLSGSIPRDHAPLQGILMGVNYGFDRVRFINPVKVGSRIRATSVLSKCDLGASNNVQLTRTMTIEIEGEEKPACVAEWVTRLVYG